MSKILGYIAALIILAFAGWLTWVFVNSIQVADPSIKAGLIGLLGMLTAATITHYQTKKREINARHFADKRAGYMQMIDLLFDFTLAQKSGRKLSDQEVFKKMILFKRTLMIWGSPEIIEAWNEYELKTVESIDKGENILRQMENILRVMRKDLGHDDSALEAGHLLALILKAEDKKKFLEALK